jgi:AcrR family transcriptional regulator
LESALRVKTEARREAILAAAEEAFRERGFEAASMADVAARVGGSKATLYNYFSSKEQLFAAVMLKAAKAQAAPIFEQLRTTTDLETGLYSFGRAYLPFMLRPEILAINRMCAADGERTGVGRVVEEVGIKVAWGQVAERLRQAMDERVLRTAEPWQAAMHLKALLEAGIVDRRVRGCTVSTSSEEIETAVVNGVDVFLRGYRPD